MLSSLSRISSILVAVPLIAVSVVSGITPARFTATAAGTVTTIAFDSLPTGTIVADQFHDKGIDFTGYILPVVTKVTASAAHSGTHVADISVCNGCEFYIPNITATLADAASTVSVYVGYFPDSANPGGTATMTLNAYDAGSTLLKSSTKQVTESHGFRTKLTVRASGIVGIQVTAGNNDTDKHLGIDDLTYDHPSNVPPNFSITAADQLINVRQGASAGDKLTIHRFNGSTGDVSFSATGLPSGVTASFAPNPATDSTTVTFTANPTAPATQGNPKNVTIKSVPSGSATGPATHHLTIGVTVKPNFYISFGTNPVSVPECSSVAVPVDVVYTHGFTGNVSLAPDSLPSGVSASFNPTTVGPPTDSGQVSVSTMTLTRGENATTAASPMYVIGTSSPYSDTSFPLHANPGDAQVTQASPASGRTPQATDNGSKITVTGAGFCPDASVTFGNALATAKPLSVSADGKSLDVRVPRLATDGQIFVSNSPVPTAKGTSTVNFSVDSYRNVSGFNFDNSDAFQTQVGGYSYQDVTDVFGSNATYLSINPCWPWTDCTINTGIPDPFALIFWGIADQALRDGQCFGFSLASQRFLHDDEPLSGYALRPDATKPTVWNLAGPDNTIGSLLPISHYIHLIHMEQFSAQYLHHWAAEAIPGNDGDETAGQVIAALHSGSFPEISLRTGTEGHAVIAYDIAGPDAQGTYQISVYDPNREFAPGENTTSNGGLHQSQLTASTITLDSNGHWQFPGNFGDSPWSGGGHGIVVTDYSVVPVVPTLPLSISGLTDLILGGSAHVSQVTDASGGTLLLPNGDVNTSSKTGIPGAVRMPSLSGSKPSTGDTFLFKHPSAYKETITGSKAGHYRQGLFGKNILASVNADTVKGSSDAVSVNLSQATVQVGAVAAPATHSRPQSPARNVTSELALKLTGGTTRTAALTSTVSPGQANSLAFDGSRKAVVISHTGPSGAYTLALDWSGPDATQQSFVSPKLKLAAGDVATITPSAWTTLAGTKIQVSVKHKNGSTSKSTISNTIKPSSTYSVSLKVKKGKVGKRKLVVITNVKHAPVGSSAVISWVIFRGKQVRGGHAALIKAAKLHAGLNTKFFVFKGKSGVSYHFSATVTISSPASSGASTSVVHTASKSFHG